MTLSASVRLVSVVSGLVALGFLFGCARESDESGKRLSFVAVSRMPAIYETKYMEECPDGLAMSYHAAWWLTLPASERVRVPDQNPRIAQFRGPNGENVCWNPTLIKEPPMPLVEGKFSYGLNLDGSTDGTATRNSCPHTNFTAPDGAPGIDNQMYRILGCVFGFRRHGEVESNADVERRDTSQGIMLIEVSGIDDVRNDDHVRVAFYKKDSRDPLLKDSRGGILPWGSYRIEDTARYGGVTSGRIAGGVLTSEPIDAHWASWGNESYEDLVLRGMRVQMPIQPSARSVKGILGAYWTFDSWWSYIAKSEIHSGAGHYSCPAIYEASKRLIDGYPDPDSGECTALSSAFHLELVPAFITKGNADSVTTTSADNKVSADTKEQGAAHANMRLPREVMIQSTEAGTYVRDARGFTLYTFRQDQSPGMSACGNFGPASAFAGKCTIASPSQGGAVSQRSFSTCTGECAKAWPPLLASDDAVGLDDWSVGVRADGSKQWAYKGKPLYRNANDTYPGARTAEERGSSDPWSVAFWPKPTPSEISMEKTPIGRVLTDSRQQTLYTLDANANSTECTGSCLKLWRPLLAGGLARPSGDWSAVLRADGSKQWAYKGNALYTYELDRVPGDTKGEGKGARAAVIDHYGIDRPAWVTVQDSDMGRIFATADGSTLYAFKFDREQVTRQMCNEQCWRDNWRPVLASGSERAIGNWSVITLEDGSALWAYKGKPLYTHARDVRPGDVYGHFFAVGMAIVGPWEPIRDPAALPDVS